MHASSTLFVKTRVDGGSLADEKRATALAKGIGPDVIELPRGRAPVPAGGRDHALVTRRVPGKHRAHLGDRELALVGAMLAELHARTCPRTLRPLPGGATLAATLAEAGTSLAAVRAVLTPSQVKRAQALLERVRRDLDDAFVDESDTPRAVCHGDVRGPNLLFAPMSRDSLSSRDSRASPARAVRLLDFGLAGRGDPAIDLARLFAYERLDEHARFVVAQAYVSHAHDDGDDDGAADATVDRALLITRAMPLALALASLRYARAAVDGTLPVADVAPFRARVPALKKRIATLLAPSTWRSARIGAQQPLRQPGGAGGRGASAASTPATPGIPRVPHLFGSKPGRDDLVVGEERVFRTRRVAIMEKLDGVAVALYLNDGGDVDVVMKREWRAALDGAVLEAARRWARAHEDKLRAVLLGSGSGKKRHILGEWLGHTLAVAYDALPSFVVMHSVVENGRLIQRVRSNAIVRRAGLAAMEPVFVGVVGDKRAWSSFVPVRARFSAHKKARAEGIVVEAPNTWAKWVAPHYRQPQPSEITGRWNQVQRRERPRTRA